MSIVRKLQQPGLTIEDQIANLKQLNLVIPDDEIAQQVLTKISYFRLIKAYGITLKPKNSLYDGKASLDDLISLYEFNTAFRQALIVQIEKVEIELRCKLTNYFCSKYGIFGYKKSDNFHDASRHKTLMEEIENAIKYNRRSPFIRNFQDNYIGGDIPFYALVEILSFGVTSKFFKNMKPEDKKAIANLYGHNWPYLQSWFESLSYVRNICAHYGRLYDVRLDKTPRISDKADNIPNNRIFGTLYCLRQLLGEEEDWSDFICEIEKLLEKYPMAKKSHLGFPENWKEILLP